MSAIIDGSNASSLPADSTINGVTVGKGGGAVSTNTAVGTSAIAASASGTYDTGIGYQSLNALTSGNYNTSIGGQSLQKLTTGSNNSAVGVNALQNVVSGSYNSAVGFNALAANTGNYNSALGDSSLAANTSGAYNTAVGQSALQANTTASSSTAFGYQAGYSSTGAGNTFIGTAAGYSVTTGTRNTFVGSSIIGVNTGSGYAVTTGSKNTILGNYDGNSGGLDIRTSSNNIVLSDGDGNPQAYNSGGNTWIANATSNRFSYFKLAIAGTVGATTYTDNVANAYYVIAGASGGVYLANTGVNWTSTSDERLKNITGEIQNGLNKVCSLRAAEFTWKSDAENKPRIGLIAQDVQAVLPEAISTTVLRDDPTETAYLGVQYSETIPLLVAAIKELKAEVDALKAAK